MKGPQAIGIACLKLEHWVGPWKTFHQGRGFSSPTEDYLTVHKYFDTRWDPRLRRGQETRSAVAMLLPEGGTIGPYGTDGSAPPFRRIRESSVRSGVPPSLSSFLSASGLPDGSRVLCRLPIAPVLEDA